MSTTAEKSEPAAPLRRVEGRVLGVDPGLGTTGYAVVEPSPRGPFVLEAGIIRPRSKSTDPLGGRLRMLHEGILEILDAFEPVSLALEQIHSHVKHPRTSILMAHARGVIVLAAAERDVPVHGYAPTRIKKTLTGSGKAPKEQMQRAIQTELGLPEPPEPHDVADACAAALCHYQIERNRRGLLGR